MCIYIYMCACVRVCDVRTVLFIVDLGGVCRTEKRQKKKEKKKK